MDEFKYMEIVQWAKQAIIERGLLAGDRFFSESELCNIHNVSRQTVRQALMFMEREGILRRRQGSGTFIQSSQFEFRKPNFTVGVISTYFSDYIFPDIVTGIERVLSQNNVVMQLATTSNMVAEETRALEAMLAQNVGGLIVEPSKSALPSPNMALYNEIGARNIPLLFINAKYAWSSFPCVAMDDVAAGRIATDHLLSLGHKKISGVFIFENIQGHKRYEGFMRSLDGSDIPMPEKRVMWFSTGEQRSLFTQSRDRVLSLLEDSTAIVCHNDDLAVKLLDFCKQQGISVPDDMSVIGIDDANMAKICEVPLTSVRHPKQKLGELAANALLEMIKDPASQTEDCFIVPELVERSSTAAIGSRITKALANANANVNAIANV